MSRRAVKKDLTRSQILSAAIDLFTQQGYEQTSIDEIAKKADVAKGTFYYHFDSKEAVVIALRDELLVDSFSAAMDSLEKGDSPIDIMERVFLDRAAWTEKNPEIAKVFFAQRIHQFLFRENEAYVFPKVTTHPLKIVKTTDLVEHQPRSSKESTSNGSNGTKEHLRLFQVIFDCVVEGQKRKQIRQDIDSSELTQIIVATFIHAQGSWLGGYSGVSLIDKVHRWFHAVLDGLYDQSFQSDSNSIC